ncbi:hypothetical protein Tco_1032907 [Tanacetum coccineum]|uniref:Uncharacterized protein n=1 Tax=Tanacetum coccineum TaxID=301880 RepID=A0ABQ5GD91_9ASTR
MPDGATVRMVSKAIQSRCRRRGGEACCNPISCIVGSDPEASKITIVQIEDKRCKSSTQNWNYSTLIVEKDRRLWDRLALCTDLIMVDLSATLRGHISERARIDRFREIEIQIGLLTVLDINQNGQGVGLHQVLLWEMWKANRRLDRRHREIQILVGVNSMYQTLGRTQQVVGIGATSTWTLIYWICERGINRGTTDAAFSAELSMSQSHFRSELLSAPSMTMALEGPQMEIWGTTELGGMDLGTWSLDVGECCEEVGRG